MGGFLGWFVIAVAVLAIFNAEKLPTLRAMLEEKFKNSVDAAKEGSKVAKKKIRLVKVDMANKKAKEVNTQTEDEDNTPEEIEESLKFMGNYLKNTETSQTTTQTAAAESASVVETQEQDSLKEEKPIDLEHRY